jgi:hypothetical protein
MKSELVGSAHSREKLRGLRLSYLFVLMAEEASSTRVIMHRDTAFVRDENSIFFSRGLKAGPIKLRNPMR